MYNCYKYSLGRDFIHDIVKVNNKMNDVSFKGFTSVEMDLFFSICSRMKEQKLKKITFPFSDLKELSQYSATANKTFMNDLIKTNEKLQKLNVNFWNDGIYRSFVLFPTFELDSNNSTVTIGVHEEFEFLLNSLESNFTRFELNEFLKLESKYSKSLFKLLKQWKTVGKKEWEIEEFKNLLAIRDTYRMSEIDKYVLKPVLSELPAYFIGLKIKKLKKGRGGKVVALEFTWQAETTSDRRKKTSQKTFRQETLPDWAEAETPPKPTLIALEDYTKLAEQMTRLGQSIEPYDLIHDRYQTELHEWLKKWTKN